MDYAAVTTDMVRTLLGREPLHLPNGQSDTVPNLVNRCWLAESPIEHRVTSALT